MPEAPSNHADPLIFISAAEPSADRIGAALIRATRQLAPAVGFVGVAGPRMAEAGCVSIFDMTGHSAMLLGTVGAARRGWALLRTARECLAQQPFAAAVVIDSPVLHLPLARRIHARGIPVLYYVAPQLWAWGAGRIRKLRRWVDELAVILPFEEEYFRTRGVAATFVGHPMFDRGEWRPPAADAVDRIRAGGTPLVALLPGSRKHVVAEVLRGQLEVARRVAAESPAAGFAVSQANEHVGPLVRAACAGTGLPVRVHAGASAELIAAADLVLVASGTTTLEVAGFGKPMIVMYNASRVAYHLCARWLVRLPHLALPNILAGREVVPEFMPYYTSTEPIARCALKLLGSPEKREAMSRELQQIIASLRTGNASQHVARMVLELAEKRSASASSCLPVAEPPPAP
ncbi:MAG TPA: lipid-A-disaccharide synthase [Phycisphaerae bacterium]|nr:lipid-A-disaccharide synthase [Phycisphaerae bacterium]HNU46458.1 lipid-A-disaccharide synthase [Phycisphaerae bacterium]